jgi:hypothetical protein
MSTECRSVKNAGDWVRGRYEFKCATKILYNGYPASPIQISVKCVFRPSKIDELEFKKIFRLTLVISNYLGFSR